jgi:hypothetical protein
MFAIEARPLQGRSGFLFVGSMKAAYPPLVGGYSAGLLHINKLGGGQFPLAP